MCLLFSMGHIFLFCFRYLRKVSTEGLVTALEDRPLLGVLIPCEFVDEAFGCHR